MQDLKDVAAIVTGGASGLGAATAARLSARGAKVTLFDINEDAGSEHANSIGGVFAKVDVTNEAEVVAAMDDAERLHGPARILINCAGVAPRVNMIRYRDTPHPLDLYRHVLEVNLVASFCTATQFTARLFNKDLPDDERGVIINTASIAAFDGQAGHAAYAASKGGLVSMTLPLARDLAQYKIRVMTIAPGLFDTPMLGDVPNPKEFSLGSQVPHPRRLGDPDEFARLVEHIVTNPMLNGEVIRLDGAFRMLPD